MLTSKQLNISVLCMAAFSVIQIIAGLMKVTFPISFLFLGGFFLIWNALNSTKFENKGIYIVLNTTLIVMSLISIISILGNA
ncbi:MULTISPECIES: hypothetical protein [Morganellaceae]|uniref:Uncharacterized protein n=1 Tax=Proteus genomosp. 6 TaxID=1311820 RepID=A0ABV1LE22_9GAMM|nr:hypothetical protein [Providencia rettgeri]